VQFIADKIITGISMASKNLLPATIKIDTVAVRAGVYNRVRDEGPTDALVRMMKIQRSDSSKLLFTTYTAHATCLFSRDLQLSGDYPARLIQMLESKGYDFAMFMAGAVGSHGPAAPDGGWVCVDWMAETISKKIESAVFTGMQNTFVEMHRVPLQLSEPQPKLLQNWRLKPQLFNTAFGQYPTFVSVLRIGDIVFLGTPCDFSGEFNFSLDSLGQSAGLFPIVTSFNGGYIGYLTPQKYYDIDHYETQLMNWYGPGNGEYVKKVLEQLLLSVAQ
jgi:neutral ceramidase